MEVVIALYLGHWPGRSNSGITDIYAVDGEWFNIPEDVAIVGWMPVPDTEHLPIADYYARPKGESSKWLGSIETNDPSIFECIFEGDYSEIGPKSRDR